MRITRNDLARAFPQKRELASQVAAKIDTSRGGTLSTEEIERGLRDPSLKPQLKALLGTEVSSAAAFTQLVQTETSAQGITEKDLLKDLRVLEAEYGRLPDLKAVDFDRDG